MSLPIGEWFGDTAGKTEIPVGVLRGKISFSILSLSKLSYLKQRGLRMWMLLESVIQLL
jgi:hypothetical protein